MPTWHQSSMAVRYRTELTKQRHHNVAGQVELYGVEFHEEDDNDLEQEENKANAS